MIYKVTWVLVYVFYYDQHSARRLILAAPSKLERHMALAGWPIRIRLPPAPPGLPHPNYPFPTWGRAVVPPQAPRRPRGAWPGDSVQLPGEWERPPPFWYFPARARGFPVYPSHAWVPWDGTALTPWTGVQWPPPLLVLLYLDDDRCPRQSERGTLPANPRSRLGASHM